MVLLEEKDEETMLAEIFETQTAGSAVIIAGHRANETAETLAIGFSV